MKKIHNILFLAIFFLVISLYSPKVFAAENKPSFSGTWTNNTALSFECIDDASNLYLVSGGSVNTRIRIFKCDFDEESTAKIRILAIDKTEWPIPATFTNNPDMSYNKAQGSYYWVGFANGPQVGDVFQAEITDGDSKEFYTFLVDGNQTFNDSYGRQASDYFAHNISLVDTSENNKIISQISTEEDWTTSTDTQIFQKMVVNASGLAVSIGRNEDLQVDTNADGYGNPSWINWLCTGEKYVRVNGGKAMRFNEYNSNHPKLVSPNLELKVGYNYIEIYQNQKMSSILSDTSFAGQTMNTAKVLLLVKCDQDITPAATSNTNILDMSALSGVGVKGEKIYRYQTDVNNDDKSYTIYLPNKHAYNKVIVGIDMEDPSATWSLVDAEGNEAGIGYIGKYGAFNSEGIDKIYLKVTAGDGSVEMKTISLSEAPTSSEAELKDLALENASLKDGEVIDKDTRMYTIVLTDDGSSDIKFTPEVSDFATVKIDGNDLEDGSVTLKPEGLSTIEITAEDGQTVETYKFLYEKADGSYPYFTGLSDSTKALAESLLTGYKKNSPESTGDMTQPIENGAPYWNVYKARSAGLSFKDAYVYDVTQLNLKQPSDYAGAILELAMVGENPHDFNGFNYVEKLASLGDNGFFGGMSQNIWAYLAFRVAGYDYADMDKLEAIVKKQAFQKTKGLDWSLDMSSWAASAVNDKLTWEEKAAFGEWMRDECIQKTGEDAGIFEDPYYDIPNSNTHGCVITALVALGIDPESYSVAEGKTPLQAMKDILLMEDGQFRYMLGDTARIEYNKDAIVGLGDIVSGQNVWVRYYVNNEGMNDLIAKAEALKGKGSDEQNAALESALATAKSVSDASVNGKAYYELLAAATAIDNGLTENIRICSVETGQTIDKLIADIEALGEVKADDAEKITDLKKAYDALGNDVIKGYVSNASVLEEAAAKVDELIAGEAMEAIKALPETITADNKKAVEEARAVYDKLSKDAKENFAKENPDIIKKLELAEAAVKAADEAVKDTEKTPTSSVKVSVKTGQKVTVGGVIYKVTASSAKKKTVTVIGTKKKTVKKLTIPATVTISKSKYKVTAIAKGAVKGKKKLTTVVIGTNVTNIGSKAFYGCSKLKKITVKGTKIKKVGAKALTGIHKKAVIKVPKKKLKAYKKIFKGKGQKKTVKIK